jgi:enoyl-[acyl-carrier protein] reductase I
MLSGKRILITGVVTRESIAYAVAERAQALGAEIVLTGFGRGLALTRRVARRLPDPPEVLELDVNDPSHFGPLAARIEAKWGGLDGVLHAIAYAPPDALDGRFLATPADSALVAFRTSAFSLQALTAALEPLLTPHASVVGLDFDAPIAWPSYDWMGVSKAALRMVSRYLARELGPRRVRVNLVSAGPLRTMASGAVPLFDEMAQAWTTQAPLGWDPSDRAPVADAVCMLLSDYARAMTGEIVFADGGVHAMGPLGPAPAARPDPTVTCVDIASPNGHVEPANGATSGYGLNSPNGSHCNTGPIADVVGECRSPSRRRADRGPG